MVFREAKVADIRQIQEVRNSVKENVLSDPGLVTDKDCEEYLLHRGKGWVCEENNRVLGFAIADLQGNNIWALFVRPEKEGMGIGKLLFHSMMAWYFSQTKEKIWLSTAPLSRAEFFYRKAGWNEAGIYGKGEIKFEMEYEDWMKTEESEKTT
jgi:GNAT superfamily N-acetyltransferase